MAETEVEQRLVPDLQWTLGDDDDKNEQEDTFGGANAMESLGPPAAPSDGQGGRGLSPAHLVALQEKRKRLK